MHRYPYHSPVRFYKSKDDLSDDTNSQNLQFFGSKNPYPLEINSYHRYLIPNYENEVDTTELELWLIGKDEIQIDCELGFNSDENRLLRISFVCDKFIQGNFEIKKTTGETIFYSNCVKFIDSSMSELHNGRKFVRVATKCYFNRLGYEFDNSEHDWFITNLPAYDYGLYAIDAEYNVVRTGFQNTPEIEDSWIDEVSTISFIAEGDCNVMNFILFSTLNNEFYLNGTRRTIKEKPEVDEFMMIGKMKFAYNKDKNGMYVPVDEDTIFSDAFKTVLGNEEKTQVYIYNTNTAIPIKNV